MMMEKKKNKKKKIKVNIEGSMLQKCNWWRRNVDVELCIVRNFSVNVCVTLYFTSSIPWYCDINPYSNNVNNGRKTYTCFDANVWRMTDNWNWQFHHTTNIRILGCSWKWRWNESAFVDDCTSVFPFKLLLLHLFFLNTCIIPIAIQQDSKNGSLKMVRFHGTLYCTRVALINEPINLCEFGNEIDKKWSFAKLESFEVKRNK